MASPTLTHDLSTQYPDAPPVAEISEAGTLYRLDGDRVHLLQNDEGLHGQYMPGDRPVEQYGWDFWSGDRDDFSAALEYFGIEWNQRRMSYPR